MSIYIKILLYAWGIYFLLWGLKVVTMSLRRNNEFPVFDYVLKWLRNILLLCIFVGIIILSNNVVRIIISTLIIAFFVDLFIYKMKLKKETQEFEERSYNIFFKNLLLLIDEINCGRVRHAAFLRRNEFFKKLQTSCNAVMHLFLRLEKSGIEMDYLLEILADIDLNCDKLTKELQSADVDSSVLYVKRMYSTVKSFEASLYLLLDLINGIDVSEYSVPIRSPDYKVEDNLDDIFLTDNDTSFYRIKNYVP